MVIELNTNPVQGPHPAHTPSFQSSFRPTASTISAQATKPGESKGFFACILDFIKKIFCCYASPKKIEGNALAKLVEKGKAEEAARAFVSALEQNEEIARDPRKEVLGWYHAFLSAGLFARTPEALQVAVNFSKKFFGIDDSEWLTDQADNLKLFLAELKPALAKSENSELKELAKSSTHLSGLLNAMEHVLST